jgi:hypothetical protein
MLRKAAPSGAAAGGQIPKTTGSPLGADVRAKMEGKLGADLSGVKVHTGGESAKAASDFGARAFTVGSDVHFNAGQFAPGTKEGDRLLAHELTHVVQGQKSGIQRKADEEKQDEEGEGGPEVSQPHEPAEQEADAVGDQVADDLHAAGDKDKKKDKKSAKGDDEKKTGEGEAAGQEEPAKADKGAEAKPAATISAKLEGVGRKIFLAPDDDELAKLGRKYDLNAASATSRQVLENFQMKCKDFIASYRKASINAEFPSEYLELTVQQALDADKSKVRKLLIDGRFAK